MIHNDDDTYTKLDGSNSLSVDLLADEPLSFASAEKPTQHKSSEIEQQLQSEKDIKIDREEQDCGAAALPPTLCLR